MKEPTSEESKIVGKQSRGDSRKNENQKLKEVRFEDIP